MMKPRKQDLEKILDIFYKRPSLDINSTADRILLDLPSRWVRHLEGSTGPNYDLTNRERLEGLKTLTGQIQVGKSRKILEDELGIHFSLFESLLEHGLDHLLKIDLSEEFKIRCQACGSEMLVPRGDVYEECSGCWHYGDPPEHKGFDGDICYEGATMSSDAEWEWDVSKKPSVVEAVSAEFTILNYSKELREDFERLNREWLEKYFVVEDVDVKYFKDPESEIIKKGGDVFFVESKGKILGTCSLIVTEEGLELAKLAVSEAARGMGLGELLTLEAIKRARQMGEKKLLLVTNSKLAPAIQLYKKLGFKITFQGQHPKYKRGDVVMEKVL